MCQVRGTTVRLLRLLRHGTRHMLFLLAASRRHLWPNPLYMTLRRMLLGKLQTGLLACVGDIATLRVFTVRSVYEVVVNMTSSRTIVVISGLYLLPWLLLVGSGHGTVHIPLVHPLLEVALMVT